MLTHVPLYCRFKTWKKIFMFAAVEVAEKKWRRRLINVKNGPRNGLK